MTKINFTGNKHFRKIHCIFPRKQDKDEAQRYFINKTKTEQELCYAS